MKAFVAATVVYVLAVAATGLLALRIDANASDVFATEAARVGHEASVDGRLGWAAEQPEG